MRVVTVHTRFEGGVELVCQFTLIDPAMLLPAAVLAVTAYVRIPATADVARHVALSLGQFAHVKLVGLPVQEASSITLVPSAGVVVVARIVHGSEPDDVPACQLTATAATLLAVVALLADTR